METLVHPTLLGVAAALIVGLIASYAVGLWRGRQSETKAGLEALCGMKWRDYAHLIEDLLQERGFARQTEDRRPGEGGFDLMMVRGSSRYLIECKNGAAHRVTEQSIRDLAGLVELQGAEGAVLATTGRVDPAALDLAANRRVEVLSGPDLWRQAKPWMPHDLREEAESRARGGFTKRLVMTLLFATIAGVLVAALAPQREAPAPLATTAAPPASVPATSAAPAVPAQAPAPEAAPIVEAPPAAPAVLPDGSLTEEQLQTRRAAAAMEIRSNPIVLNAVWTTKSTMVVTLRQAGGEIPDALFDDVCKILVLNEEMRYTRVQVDSPAPDDDTPAKVRWRQCI